MTTSRRRTAAARRAHRCGAWREAREIAPPPDAGSSAARSLFLRGARRKKKRDVGGGGRCRRSLVGGAGWADGLVGRTPRRRGGCGWRSSRSRRTRALTLRRGSALPGSVVVAGCSAGSDPRRCSGSTHVASARAFPQHPEKRTSRRDFSRDARCAMRWCIASKITRSTTASRAGAAHRSVLVGAIVQGWTAIRQHDDGPRPTEEARTVLLRTAWQKHGYIHPGEAHAPQTERAARLSRPTLVSAPDNCACPAPCRPLAPAGRSRAAHSPQLCAAASRCDEC